MLKLVRPIPDYVICHVVEMETAFIARHSGRFNRRIDGWRAGIGTSGLGVSMFMHIAGYLSCGDLCGWQSTNRTFGFELCDSAAFVSLFTGYALLLCFPLY